jgi:hypothetical protein
MNILAATLTQVSNGYIEKLETCVFILLIAVFALLVILWRKK